MRYIKDLKNQLYLHNWTILEELDGNNLDISGYWKIQHLYNPAKSILLAFEGMGDLEVLPLEQSYACFLVDHKEVSLYFCKNNPKKWKKDLNQFVLSLFLYVNPIKRNIA